MAFADFIGEEDSVRRRSKKTTCFQTPSRSHSIASPFAEKTPSTAVQNIITLAIASGRVSDRKKRKNSTDLQQLSTNNSPSTEVLPRKTRRRSRLF